MNSKIREVENQCQQIVKKFQNYNMKLLEFNIMISNKIQSLGSSPAEERLKESLRLKVRAIETGYKSKSIDLKTQYKNNLKVLLSMKKEILNSSESNVTDLNSEIVKEIRSLRLIISDFEKELSNAKCEDGECS